MLSDKVIELHGATVKSINDQAQALEKTVEMIRQMHKEMVSVKGEVDSFKEEIYVFRKEFRDENRLLPSETDELELENHKRAVAIAKQLTDPTMDDKEFKQLVGKMKKKIWRKLNRKFGVARYINIKRKDFEVAKEFIRNFKIEDYI